MRAATDGEAFAYSSHYPFVGSPTSAFAYRARRGPSGWSVEAMTPQLRPGASIIFMCEYEELLYSPDLSTSVLGIGFDPKEWYPTGTNCDRPQEELASGEPIGFRNLLRRDGIGASYELLNPPLGGEDPANAVLQDGSADLSHVVFGEDARLTPGAPPGFNLYEWANGGVHLVTTLPDGSTARGDLAGATSHGVPGVNFPTYVGGEKIGTAPVIHAVSTNGERIFFYANGDLYLRENASRPQAAVGSCSAAEPADACTVQVDVSRGGVGSGGGGIFQFASADGSRVFFTDESKLTSPSSAVTGKPDLYEYDVETEELTDLTFDPEGPANVRGFSGAAYDGSYVYFVANGVLTGSQENSHGAVARLNYPNIYVAHDGVVTFIASLARSEQTNETSPDRNAWSFEFAPQASEAPTGTQSELFTRTSPNGAYIAFNSVRGLTGNAEGTRQIYLFDAESGELSCASCLPGGGAPLGSSALEGLNAAGEAGGPGFMPANLDDRGQFFFTSEQALLTGDTNGVADVYEFDHGALRLISAGTGVGASYFLDASEGAHDVFFATSDALVRRDTDNSLNIYDARVEGGFVEPATPPEPCGSGEGCRPTGAGTPASTAAGTSTYTGPGNAPPPKSCGRGKARRRGRCVKTPKHMKGKSPKPSAKRKKNDKHHAKRSTRRAQKNRRKR